MSYQTHKIFLTDWLSVFTSAFDFINFITRGLVIYDVFSIQFAIIPDFGVKSKANTSNVICDHLIPTESGVVLKGFNADLHSIHFLLRAYSISHTGKWRNIPFSPSFQELFSYLTKHHGMFDFPASNLSTNFSRVLRASIKAFGGGLHPRFW